LQPSLTTFENEIRLLRSACVRQSIGRLQQTKGVRKLVTRKYRYLIYYTVDEVADEIIILSVKHPAQRQEHEES